MARRSVWFHRCNLACCKLLAQILDLGCGWGSVTLFLAQKYPNAQITSVSNSSSQRKFIEGECRARGHRNVSVITADANVFQAPEK